jgi:hypothetical protein
VLLDFEVRSRRHPAIESAAWMGSSSDTSSPRRDLRPPSAQVVKARFEQAVRAPAPFRGRVAGPDRMSAGVRPQVDRGGRTDDSPRSAIRHRRQLRPLVAERPQIFGRLHRHADSPRGRAGPSCQDGPHSRRRRPRQTRRRWASLSTAALGRSRPAIYGRGTSSRSGDIPARWPM